MWRLRSMGDGLLSERVVKGVNGCGGFDYESKRGLCVFPTEGDARFPRPGRRKCPHPTPHLSRPYAIRES